MQGLLLVVQTVIRGLQLRNPRIRITVGHQRSINIASVVVDEPAGTVPSS